MKKWRKMMKTERNEKMDSDAKSSTISKVYRCCCNFSSKSSTISMILFRNVSLSRGKSTTRFAGSAFFRRKVTIFIGRETKTHILQTKINGKKTLRSADLTIIILLEYYNHSTTTTTPPTTTTTTNNKLFDARLPLFFCSALLGLK